ncbi:hypothetical protein [Actinomadura bangladeshensis]|uniref:Uncharacterized protein n=1 Tax=Actinomadura bangladeshensis TaxID=453573 RepID=A0A6L9Q889_9ACTN|nr:hypothetical protein [Actinomadura bangladeshensis]NEA21700.1 hypothetical protein [Actinomadura bangladeshensis]
MARYQPRQPYLSQHHMQDQQKGNIMAMSTMRQPTAPAAGTHQGARSPIARKALILGSSLALALGILAAPAQAFTGANADEVTTAAMLPSGTAQGRTATWHFWKSYWTRSDCYIAGLNVKASNPRYKKARCVYGRGTDDKRKWHLYIRY